VQVRAKRSRPIDERGAGLIGTIGGVMVFLTLLTFAVQMLFNLYATSAVTAVAHDAARTVAGGVAARDADTLPATVADAELDARRALGRYGDRLEFLWEIDDGSVRLTLAADHPRVAITPVSEVFGLNRVERTVEVWVVAVL
jgi:hypothetical protein